MHKVRNKVAPKTKQTNKTQRSVFKKSDLNALEVFSGKSKVNVEI